MLKRDDYGLELDPDGPNTCGGGLTRSCLRGRPGPLFNTSGFPWDTSVNPCSSVGFAVVDVVDAVITVSPFLNSTVLSMSSYRARCTLALYAAKLGHAPLCHDK